MTHYRNTRYRRISSVTDGEARFRLEYGSPTNQDDLDCIDLFERQNEMIDQQYCQFEHDHENEAEFEFEFESGFQNHIENDNNNDNDNDSSNHRSHPKRANEKQNEIELLHQRKPRPRSHTREIISHVQFPPRRGPTNKIKLYKQQRKRNNVINKRRWFKCQTCNKKFETEAALVRHNLMHLKQPKYICPFCGKNFRFERTLMKHINSKVHEADRRRCMFTPLPMTRVSHRSRR